MLRLLSINALSSDAAQCIVSENGMARTVHVTVRRETVDSRVLLWLNFAEADLQSSLGIQRKWVTLLHLVGDFLEGIEITLPCDIPEQHKAAGT